MKLKISTKVKGEAASVFRAMDENLLQILTPPGSKVNLLRYDGNLPGDEIHVELKVFGIKMKTWISVVKERKEDMSPFYFSDEGVEMPFGLKNWVHFHRVTADGYNSIITDDLQFSTGNFIKDRLVWGMFYSAFVWRKHLYRSYFKNR